MEILKSKVVIFGSSGHAKSLVDIIESDPNFELVGFIDNLKLKGDEVLNYKVIGEEKSLPELMSEYGFEHGVVGIGENFLRSRVVEKILKLVPNFQFINCIHKSANISKHIQMGVGNVVMAGASIKASSIVSNHSIINTNSSLGHDCNLEDFISLAPNSAVGGNCNVGKYSHIGIGASVIQKIDIGRNCIIGGGSLVNKHTESDSIYYGVPAKLAPKQK